MFLIIDSDTNNGNTVTTEGSGNNTDDNKEDINKNEMSSNSPQELDNKNGSSVTSSDSKETSHENGNYETVTRNVEQENIKVKEFIPKYKYSQGKLHQEVY